MEWRVPASPKQKRKESKWEKISRAIYLFQDHYYDRHLVLFKKGIVSLNKTNKNRILFWKIKWLILIVIKKLTLRHYYAMRNKAVLPYLKLKVVGSTGTSWKRFDPNLSFVSSTLASHAWATLFMARDSFFFCGGGGYFLFYYFLWDLSSC